jgi:putative Mg2+ transporter-C (MgtC) family protein
MNPFLLMVVKLGAAALLGALVGLERERHDRPAGLRTHMLVCVGSTLITLVSYEMGRPNDVARIAAQIVTGIGFLGAGTIYRAGGGIRGLTTAAGLWVVAGIGMAIGAGGEMLWLAAITAAIIFVANVWIRRLEDRVVRGYQCVVIRIVRGRDVLTHLLEGLADQQVFVREVHWLTETEEGDEADLRLQLRTPVSLPPSQLAAWISGREGVRRVDLV